MDWARLSRDGSYWAGIEVPNHRNLEVASDAVLYLRANQSVIPTDPNGAPDTEFADLVVNKNLPADGVSITGTGVIDGMAADQRGGNGYDGIQLHRTRNSTVSGVTIRNIRGINALGGPTESFAIQFLNSIANNSVANVKVTTNSALHRRVSSTGIAVTHGANVTIVGSAVNNLQGRCFSSYYADNVVRRNNVGDGCDSAAFGNEFGHGGRDYNNWYVNSGYGLDLSGETDYQGTGMVIAGNRSFGVVFSKGCSNILLRGDIFPHPMGYIGGDLRNCSFTDELVRR